MWRAGALTIVLVFGACDGAEAVPAAPAVVQSSIQSPIQTAILPKTSSVSETPRFRYVDLRIESSLEATCVGATNIELGQKLAQVAKRVLVWWVDVHRQLHKGDRIELVYEVPDDPNLEPVVHAIWFQSRQLGRALTAVRHRIDGDTFARWYDQDGAEIERRLINGPLGDYEQITSLVGDGRGHRGLDFKAPIGTPVISPFNGQVKRKNWARRRNGNCLEIVDSKTGLTAYFLHLDSFAKGMRAGARVKKGQLLARSGNTGRSSAPHLHYQLERPDGRAVDPFRVHRMERRKLPREKVAEVQQALQRFGTYRTGSSKMVAVGQDLTIVSAGSKEAAIIDEELSLLAKVQRQLAEDSLNRMPQAEYDQELLSLRDQIAEAHVEDMAPLIAEMYRMQALGAANGKGQSLPVDVKCPYFGHLKLNDGSKVRDVLIGNRGFVKPGAQPIVDWRNAPVSRIYYIYDEGDDYDENFGGRPVQGTVDARRTLGIVNGELRRITWSGGACARRGDGKWVLIPLEARPTLAGGAGVATRPPPLGEAAPKFLPGKLGVVGDESLREDKHLKEITALIDPKQFELITQPDSGIVILQGGAGSGKTTVALHRAAYLHYANPSVFTPKKMAVVVKSEPLTEYIARVLPSLDVSGTPVVTLNEWMHRTRKKVLPEIKRKYTSDVPAAVSRLKKHPAVLKMLEMGVERDADHIASEMMQRTPNEQTSKAVKNRWNQLARLALLPRIREMSKWLDGPQAERAGLDGKTIAAVQGVLRRTRSAHDDLLDAWAAMLTDESLLRAAFEKYGKDPASEEELAELIKWVSSQAEDEPEKADEEDEEPRAEKSEIDELAAASESSEGPADDEQQDDHVGVDGRALEEDSPVGKLDEHDDALLLKLTQLKYGGLPIAGSQKTVSYEHVVVDEAQDLSPTDIAVLRGSLTKRESMTLAGDTAQKLIFDNGFEDWETMLRDVGVEGVKIDQLKISYRSTKPIVDFSRYVLGPLADPTEPIVPRGGAPAEQFLFGSTGEAIAFLGESLRSLVVREKRANVAIVARYAAQADIYYSGLKKAEVPALRRIYGKEFSFLPGIDVVDVAQIKGLEYDYIILVEVNANTYPEAKEARHLLHIAATRAVHQLWVTSVGDPSPLLPPQAF